MTDTAVRNLVDEYLEDGDLDALDELDPEDRRFLLEAITQRLGEWAFDVPGFRNEKAMLAMAMLRKVDWLAYGGAAGGGKTEVGLKHAYDLSREIDGHSTLVLRTKKPELRRSIVFRSIARFRKLRVPAKLRNQENVLAWHFEDTGAIMEFGFCGRDEDVGQFLSAEYGFVWFDEATQFALTQILPIIGRCRVTTAQQQQGAREHVLFTTNPGSQSHMWFYEFFVQPTGYGECIIVLDISDGIENARSVRVLPMPKTVAEAEALDIERSDDELVIAFIPAFITDNPHLAKSYRRSLLALPETERKQKLYGDWDTYDGQYFEDWSNALHVIPSFPIPPSWPRARGVDWGFAKPWACLWGAWDEDGDLHVYRELYGAEILTADQARQAKAASTMIDDAGNEVPETIKRTAADPAVFLRHGTGATTASIWAENGLVVSRAQNKRDVGWSNVRAYLRPDPERQGRPRMYVHDCCHNLIRTLPRMMRDKHDPEDLDTDLEDHAVDALRYLAMVKPVAHRPQRPENRPGLEGHMDRMFEKLRRTEKLRDRQSKLGGWW